MKKNLYRKILYWIGKKNEFSENELFERFKLEMAESRQFYNKVFKDGGLICHCKYSNNEHFYSFSAKGYSELISQKDSDKTREIGLVGILLTLVVILLGIIYNRF